jgi:sigma-B regulation protein RsbU (phosphoserine phosphatase)
MAAFRDPISGREYPLGATALIGRDLACDIRVSAVAASRRHARIFKEGGGYFIEDLGSAHGTYVNGKRIEGPTPLHAADHVNISDLQIVFQDDEGKAPETKAAAKGERTDPNRSALAGIASTITVDPGLRAGVAPEAKLRAILEISKNLSNALNLDVVLPKILGGLFAIFPQADRGFILLFDPRTGQLRRRATRLRAHDIEMAPLSQTILNQALQTCQGILTADAGVDERFDVSQSIRILHIRSLMCVPLLSQENQPLGVIQVDTKSAHKRFAPEDLDVLVCVSTQAARAIEVAQLYEARRDQEAIDIQKSFLPSERPRIEDFRFFDHYTSAQHIGGDYYDYIPLPGNRLAVAVGDVAGKGVSAALLMARVSAFARFHLAGEPDVCKAVALLNADVSRTTSIERFVTFVVAVIDLRSFATTLVNAGHPPPLLRRGQSVTEVGKESAGLPLAVFDKPYEQTTFDLRHGDSLVLFTDGVTDARSPHLEVYGLERLRQVIQAGPLDAEDLGNSILTDIRRFTAGRPPGDDTTLVCLMRG